MTTATVTSKGQVTIPADVRQRMGLGVGDRIDFIELENGEFSIKVALNDVRSLKGLLRKPASAVSVDQMKVAVQGRATKRHGG